MHERSIIKKEFSPARALSFAMAMDVAAELATTGSNGGV